MNRKNGKNRKYRASICLNMIVKDEAHIIHEVLESTLKYISYWVISDTGSTDGTQDIIKKFYAKHKIPGELHEDKWEDFGHNRSLALEYAHGKADYIWVFDADDLVEGEINFPR